ncbi:ABC transporter substrate-binding protein [Rhodococcus globerulus]|uniref:ABC transporter substrate-binding protein n=1 Tax=Rhodococcus globerulus TaxID=33008 RepID=UPI003019DEB0
MSTIALATVASCLLLTGCAGNPSNDSGGTGDPASTALGAVGITGDQPAAGDPQEGGTLVFASYAPVASLDPTKTQPGGSAGGTEMAAIYDLLVRYDASTQTYEPQLAKSLTESDDHLSWTLKLRDGVTFNDGTALNAQAVVASTNRFNQKRGANSELFLQSVKSVEATDDSTVVYMMNQPWSEFPSLLNQGHGMVVGTASDLDGKFTPIGAGAFTLARLTGTELELNARPEYWNGKPHLDAVKFVDIKDDQPKIDALKSGGVHMAYLRNPTTVSSAKSDFPGYFETVSMMDVGQINNREGRPGSDVRVRKAMALAIDPEVINQRVMGGLGMPGTEIFQPWSTWHSDVKGLTPNLDEAKKLTDEAKADGFDGKITYVAVQSPASQAMALTAQSMLQAAGFDVEIVYTASATDMIKRIYVDHDFDLSSGAFSIADAAPYVRLYSTMHSGSSNNIAGLDDPEIDSILADIQTATTTDAKRSKIADLQKAVDQKAPFMAWGAGASFVPWTSNVYGVVPSMTSIMLLDQTWIN